MTIIWPRSQLQPETESWTRGGVFTSGGRLVSGGIKGGRTDGGGFWVCTMKGLVLERPQIKLWRALEVLVGDGVTEFVLPMCEAGFRPISAGVGRTSGIPHSDGTLFSDGTGYTQDPIVATVAEPAARRATTLVLDMEVSGPLEGGEHFSFDHPTERRRMYTVGQILSVDGTIYTITTEPLREAITSDQIADGVAADFNTPGVVMVVANPDQFGVDVVSNHWAEKDVMFVEAI